MAFPAARMNDSQLCDAHGPAPLAEGAPTVRINSQSTVRVGDAFPCGGCQNRVQTGASTVTFGGEFATRAADGSEHGGRIVIGSTNVVIGGPTGMGCIGAGKRACEAMAAGRTAGKTGQSYGNCVLESVRQVLRRAKGVELTEDEMMQHARPKAGVSWNPGQHDHGGANGEVGRQILEDFGVPAERTPADGPARLEDVKQAIAERRGVVAFVDPNKYSPDLYTKPANHAVAVTGVELDRDGNVIAVFLNDTGAGECGKKVPASQFSAALRGLPAEKNSGGAKLLVTKGPIG